MRTLVVVLNWNGVDDTLSCLDALDRQTHDDFDALVIDNGSVGDDVARLRKQLLKLGAGINLLVTGGVLILAATVDAVSRLRGGNVR